VQATQRMRVVVAMHHLCRRERTLRSHCPGPNVIRDVRGRLRSLEPTAPRVQPVGEHHLERPSCLTDGNAIGAEQGHDLT